MEWLAIGLGSAVLVVLVAWLHRRMSNEKIQRYFWNPVYDRLAWFYDAVETGRVWVQNRSAGGR